MSALLAWVLFAVAALVAIVGAKALDDRDRRRFSARSAVAKGPSGQAPSSDPPSGGYAAERISLEPDGPPSTEIVS